MVAGRERGGAGRWERERSRSPLALAPRLGERRCRALTRSPTTLPTTHALTTHALTPPRPRHIPAPHRPHHPAPRPVILPDYAEIELRICQGARSPAQVTFDGKSTRDLLPGESVRVRMSPNPVPTINHFDQTTDWFGAIERCFKWNDRMQQKTFSATTSSASSLDSVDAGGQAAEDLEVSA